MELLYAKAVDVQTRGYAALADTKQRQEIEVAKQAQCRKRIAGLSSEISDLEGQLAAGRATLVTCSEQLAHTAQQFDGNVSDASVSVLCLLSLMPSFHALMFVCLCVVRLGGADEGS
jgi:uncharacterized phage infection (PIP) family protein YhgE